MSQETALVEILATYPDSGAMVQSIHDDVRKPASNPNLWADKGHCASPEPRLGLSGAPTSTSIDQV